MITFPLIYLPLLLIFIVHIEASCNSKFNCTSEELCWCAMDWRCNYELGCEKNEQNVNLQFNFELKKMFIQCTNLSSYDLLPDKDLSSIQIVVIEFCPLFVNQSIHSILQKLNVRNLKQIHFQSSTTTPLHLTKKYFENMEQLQHLKLFRNNLTLEDDFLRNNPNLETIELQNNHLKIIGNVFRFSPKLVDINLAVNDLEILPNNIFENLSALKTLDLRNNHLINLNRTLLQSTRNLISLDLTSNDIEHLAVDAFWNLPNLNYISLRMNKIGILKRDQFRNNLLLKKIQVEFNRHLLFVEDYTFANMKNLRSINLSNCNLENIPTHIFENSSNIIEIDLQFNQLETLPEKVFSGLNVLQKLQLNNNKISHLPDAVFSFLPKLEKLLLNNNLLLELNDKLFSRLYNLQSLILKSNNIHTIHENVCFGSNKLEIIDLSYNNWTYPKPDRASHVSKIFNNCSKIRKIYVSHNFIYNDVESFIRSKPNLEELDLSFNDLTHIKMTSLNTMSSSLKVNLSNNKITTISFEKIETLFDDLPIRSELLLESITEVAVSNNSFRCDCSLLDVLLYYNDLLDPRIKRVFNIQLDDVKCDDVFLLKELKPATLTCALNASCPVECNFCEYKPYDSTVVIDCSDKGLKEYPQIQLNSPEIKFNELEIDLSGNLLRRGPTAELFGQYNVTTLNIEKNWISNITWIPPTIKVLKLNHNNITSLNSKILDLLNESITLQSIKLDHNPWICDCSSGKFVSYLTDNQAKVNSTDIQCYGFNQTLLKLKENVYCKSYMQTYMIGIIVTIAIFIQVATALALYYRYRQQIKAWLYDKNLCLLLITEEELDQNKKYDVFISYSHKDEEFVKEELLPVLEDGPHFFKVCIHLRDWGPGEYITTQIANSVQESRRTLVVLSKNFLESVWGRLEFRTAHTQALNEGRTRVIVVIYDDVDIDGLDDEFKTYLRTNTYIKWGDPWFWTRLNYALPHRASSTTTRSRSNDKMLKQHSLLYFRANLSDETPSTKIK